MNYANHPETIGELKAAKTNDAAAWSPRDALVYLLREIDAGRVTPDALVVIFRDVPPDSRASCSAQVIQAAPDLHVAIGLAYEGAHQLCGMEP